MPAPKGNKYWMKAYLPGRKRTFKDGQELWNKCVGYFETASKTTWFKTEQLKKPITTTHITPTGRKKVKTQYLIQIPQSTAFTYQGLCLHIGVNTRFFNWFKSDMEEKSKTEDPKVKEMAEDFLDVLARIDDVMYCQKLEGAMVGAFHAGLVASSLKMAKYEESTDKLIIVEVDE